MSDRKTAKKNKTKQNAPQSVLRNRRVYYGRRQFQHPFHCKGTVPVPARSTHASPVDLIVINCPIGSRND